MENAIFDCRKKNKILKTLAISKIIHFSLITNVPTEIINELNKTHTQKKLLGMDTVQKLWIKKCGYFI